MTQRLKSKVAIVTGANRGTGAAIAKRFAAEGTKVALLACTVEPGTSKLDDSLTEVGDWIREHGGEWVINLSSATVMRPRPAPCDFSELYTEFHLEHGPSIYASSKAAL